MSEAETVPGQAASEGRARKSSFFLAMRILPKPRRSAMYEIYSFCRQVDDIADEGGDRAQRRAALDQWRRDIDAIYADGSVPPRLRDLAAAIRTFALRRADFHAVIDGMMMDVAGDIRGPSWPVLEHYCDCVACAVGRLSVRTFGTPEPLGTELAHHLGLALQLTNILRDIDEDAAIGRLYLPHEALDKAGIASRDPSAVAADPRLPKVCEEVAGVIRGHFDNADRIMKACPRQTVKAPRVMYEAYREIFEKTVAQGFGLPRRRVRVSKVRFIASLLRHGLI